MIHSQMQWMNEAFLQFAWANRHFDPGGLLSTSGEPIDILEPGTWNQDQGPDFVMARIRIADQVWVGHVEIHCRSSDWQRHRHTGDPSYGNIILHVVWEADTLLGPDCPVLELNGRIPGRTIERFTTWMTGPTSFPCAPDFRQAAKHADQIWRKELVTSRLEARASEILARLEQLRGNWLSTIWIQVARGFGYRVNADAFTAIARSIPYTCLARHRDDLHLLEALLLGQAGCLAQSFTDAYPGMLKKEYQILRRKYRLPAVNVILHFLRMRPVNFPTVRLAQLAMLIHRHLGSISDIGTWSSTMLMDILLDVQASSFWDTHFLLDKISADIPKHMGSATRVNMLINVFVPLLYAWGKFHDDSKAMLKSLDWLQELPPENNRLTRRYAEQGMILQNAFATQAVHALHTQWCAQIRCLECAVGRQLLGKL